MKSLSQVMRIYGIDQGLNDFIPASMLNPKYATVFENFSFDKPGVLKVRNGSTYYNGDANWDNIYDGNVLPGADTPVWTVTSNGTFTQTSDGDKLTITVGSTGTDVITYNIDPGSMSNATGTTFEINAKVVSGGMIMQIFDGTKFSYIRIESSYIYDGTTYYYMDTTDDYHTYRLTLKTTVFNVYVDNVIRISGGKTAATANDYFLFGIDAGSSRPSNILVDYAAYYDGGDSAPLAGVAEYDAGNAITGIHRYYYGASSKLMLWATSTKLYKGADATGAGTAIRSDLTANKKTTFLNWRNVCIISNNTNPPFEYDGTNYWDLYVPDSGTATETDAGAGSLTNGVYSYRLTFVTPAGESSGGKTFGLTVASGPSNVNLTFSVQSNGVDANAEVTSRKIYRTAVGGSTYKLVTTIADNTTTAFKDTVADGSLGANCPTANGIVPLYSLHEIFINRLFTAGDINHPRRLYYSDLNDFNFFPASNYIDCSLAYGDKITGVKKLGSVLYVFGDRSIIAISGDEPANLAQSELYQTIGCIAPNSIVEIEGVMFFLSRRGVYTFDGGNLQLISEPVKNKIDTINKGEIDDAYGAFYNGQYWLAYAEEGSSTNNRALVYDIRRNGWGYYSGINAYCLSVWEGFGDEGELYAGSPTLSYIYKLDSGSDDVGTAVTAKYRSPEFDMQYPYLDKLLRELHLDYYSAVVAGTITYYIDGTASGTTDSLTVTAGTATGKRTIAKYASDLGDYKTLSLDIVVTGAANTFKVYGLNLMYELRRLRSGG